MTDSPKCAFISDETRDIESQFSTSDFVKMKIIAIYILVTLKIQFVVVLNLSTPFFYQVTNDNI